MHIKYRLKCLDPSRVTVHLTGHRNVASDRFFVLTRKITTLFVYLNYSRKNAVYFK
jgi:hypothetical protein